MPFVGSVLNRLYNWVADRDAGIDILASKMDGEFNNVFDGVNQVLLGNVPFTGAIKNVRGTPLLPAYTFTGDTNTGLGSLSPDTLFLSAGGVKVFDCTPTNSIFYNQFNLSLAGNIATGTPSGMVINSYTPSVILNDISSGSGAIALVFNSGVLRIIQDTQNDGQIGNSSNNSDIDLLIFNLNELTYRGSTMWSESNDGAGSGLDADLLDGFQASQFLRSDGSDTINGLLTISYGNSSEQLRIGYNTGSSKEPYISIYDGQTTRRGYIQGDVSRLQLAHDSGGSLEVYTAGLAKVNGNKIWTEGNDGAGSGLDADLLDGFQASSFRDASLLSSGTIPDARLPITITSNITGNSATATLAATASNANLLNGQNGSFYQNAGNLNAGNIPPARIGYKQSWTPTGVNSFFSTDCVYIDLGQCVVVCFNVNTDNNVIGGLPFTSENLVPFVVNYANGGGQAGIVGEMNWAQVSGNTIQFGTNANGQFSGCVTYIKN